MDFIVEKAKKTQENFEGIEVKPACIKVFGSGGAGNNMVTWLYKKGVKGAEIIACNTDQQHLEISAADRKFLIGKDITKGLGCGGFPEKGAESAQESLENYKITAPYDGIVLASEFRVGEQAGGAGMISVISDDFIIKVTISENDIAKVLEGNEVFITLDAYPDMEFTGEIIKIIPISVTSGNITSFEVLIEFEVTEDIEVYYGLSANTSIVARKVENVLYVPIQSVYREEGKSYVDLLISDQIDPENPAQSVKKTEVTTGINDYLNIEITSGLSEGDVIVTSRI